MTSNIPAGTVAARQKYQVWIELDWYQLRYSIIFKQGQKLHGQILALQMSPRQLTSHVDGVTIQLLKFGLVLLFLLFI